MRLRLRKFRTVPAQIRTWLRQGGRRRGVVLLVVVLVATLAPVSVLVPPGRGGGNPLSWLTARLDAVRTMLAGPPAPRTGKLFEGAAWSPPGRSGPAADRPKPPGKRVKELTEKATATRTVYQLDDGRLQMEMSAAPVRFRDAAGNWRPIDTTITKTGSDTYGNTGTGFATTYTARPDALVDLRLGGSQLTVGVPGAARTTPVVQGSTVTYRNVWDGADLVYELTPTAVKKSIVLSRPPAAAASYRFTLRAGGLTARTLPDGTIGFFTAGARSGAAPVFVVPKPFMVDATKNAGAPYGHTYSDKVAMTAITEGATTTVTVTPDQAWLTAKDRRYPVVLDPTIEVRPDATTAQDAMIVSYGATSNYGSDPRLGVGVDRWGRIRSLVRFDLTGVVPAGTAVDAADLSVYRDNTVLSDTASTPLALEARAVSQSWSQSTVTWNTINAAMGAAAGTATVNPAQSNSWVTFPVTGTVRNWVTGAQPNNGFMVKAVNETTVAGGPVFQSGDFPVAAVGDWPNYTTKTRPKLTLTFGLPAVAVPDPQTVRATGAELSWPAYTDPSPADADNLVEYQVHRSAQANFTPTAATLVAPLPSGTTRYADTTATPDTTVHYRVAVLRKDGQLAAAQSLAVKTPPAGYVDANLSTVADTTITACEYTSPHDTLYSRPLVGIGYVPGGYGVTRGLVKWDLSSIPSTARIVQAEGRLWRTLYSGNAAYFATHLLTRDFDETASWLNASTGVPWTNIGGDAVATPIQVIGLVPTINSVWVDFGLTGQVQGWVANPASNKGILIRQVQEPNKACVGSGEGATFISSEGDEPSVQPRLHVRYTDTTVTYYAPATPVRFNPGETTTVPVTITNTTTQTWPAASTRLGYWWKRPDGSDATTAGSQLMTTIPADLGPGATVTVNAQVKAPALSGDGNKAEAYTLAWDLYDTTSNNWKSASSQLPQLPQQIRVEDPTSDLLGLEKFYSYAGKNTGAGGAAMNNLYAGNTAWSYNAFSNPSRGLSTFVRMTYNSLDTSASSMGFGWSLQASTIQRLGSQLSFHPPGQKWPTQVRATDGDGTTNVWVLDTHGLDVKDCTPSTCDYTHPRGVHLYLQQTGSADPTRTWVFTRPDRTQFFFDDDGFQSAVVDKNGSTLSFTYERRKSNNKPTKFLRYITDPAGRRTLTLDYYEKGEATYPYVDDNTWQDATGTSLTNPFIIDSVKSITDVSGRKITFTYTLKGLMAKMVDGDGSTNGAPKTFRFQYDMTQGNKNVKLVQTTDPRGHSTKFAYYTAPVDPQNKWKLADLTDRLGGVTHFDYVDPDGPQLGTIHTTVTDAEQNKTLYQMDNLARPFQLTNAKNEITKLVWDGDNNVRELTEANDAVSSWEYDPKTGYPLTIKDAESVKNNWSGTTLDYTTSLNGYIADLSFKTSPEGRKWQFGYDAKGNLTSVTDPLGVASSTAGDYTSVYVYDTLGQLFTEKDANGNVTTYGGYHASGYPQTITDAKHATTNFGYDDRGNVIELRNAKQAKTTQTYDTFGRPLDRVEPVDAAANRLLTTRAPVYDVNDNITTAYAANGASSTSVYDNADQVIESLAPKDEANDPVRRTTTTYDKVGNVRTVTEPEGNLTPTAGDYTTTTRYDAIYQPIEVTNGLGQKVTSVYDNVGNLRTLIDAKKNATADPADFTTKYEYDFNHQVTKTTDVLGHFTTSRYDRDGLMVGTTDAEGNETLSFYNPRGDLIESRVPYSKDASGNITYRTSKYEYDQVGNQTKFITPRGVATARSDDFVQVTVYDELNRQKEIWSAYDEGDPDPRYRTPDKTIYEYDEVGNQTKVSAPPSEGQTVRNDTVYTYYDNGWQKTATDPWNVVNSFDYNDLGQQIKNTLAPAGTTVSDAASRTMTWDYYPSGNQKSRSDDGLPVGRDVVLVDSSDSNNTASQGTWTVGAATGQYGYDVYTAAAGTGSAQFNWQLNIPRDGTYEVFVQYPQISGAATDAKFTVTHSGGSTTRTVNQTQNAGTWVSLGSYSFVEDGAQKVTLTDQATGKVVADVVKLVRSNAGESDNEKKTFTYKYNANGLMTEVKDLSPNVKIDTYRIGYDQLNQVSKVEEFAPNTSTPKNTTEQTYDANGNLATTKHNLTWSKIDYDPLDMVSTVTNADSPTAGNQQISTFTYTARGDMLKQVKPNGNTVDFEYYLDGSIRHQVEKTRAGTVVAEHTLEYTANGNASKDVLKLMNADNSADYIDNTYTYNYDPQDRVVKVTKTGDSSATEDYVYDGNGNVVRQTVGGVQTTNKYDRNRLHSSTTGGVTSTYNYDPIGRLDTVSVLGQRAQKYYYDGFDRTAKVTAGTGATAKSTTYVYDPFDRTVSQTEAGKTTSFTYLALDKLVLREDAAPDKADKSYQYAPWGDKLTQIKHKDDGTREYSQFTYRPRGDVIAVTKDDGTTRATYGYTAYGKDDESQMTGADKPDETNPDADPYNAFRFNASRWDADSGTYDMGFRNYDPGLNRFLTRDYYGAAMEDMNLTTDPYTNNRYAFAGGNPISFVEIDGHLFGMSWSDIGHAALDVVGMVPVVGEVADVANGIWYMAEGNYVDGVMSLASAIPLAGNVVGAAKLAKTGKKVYDAVDTTMDAAKQVDNAVDAAKQVDNAVDASKAATPPKTPDAPKADAPPAARKPDACNSFVPGTQVLLADGSTKPIEQVQVGDEVLASDVEADDRQARPVTALIPGNGVKHLYTITVDTDGSSGDQTGQIVATDNHRFWLPDAGVWVTAKQLKPGMWLQTGSGTWVQVTQVEHETKQQRVHNFTVDGVHSYYVLAGDKPVLVHNDACPTDQKLLDDAKAIHGAYQSHLPPAKAARAQDRITVVTAHIGGKKYYSVSSNRTDKAMREMAEKLGYTRIHGKRFTSIFPRQRHAEQIMLNALKRGEISGSGRMSPSRQPCVPGTKSYEGCAARVASTPGIRLVGWG